MTNPLHKGTETLVRDRERLEIEGVRDRESKLYSHFCVILYHFINEISLYDSLWNKGEGWTVAFSCIKRRVEKMIETAVR